MENITVLGMKLEILIIIMLVLLVISIAGCITLLVMHIKLKKRYDKFMLGKNAASLEEEIQDLFEINKAVVEKIKENRKDIRKLYKKFTKAFQKIGIIKYDAYQQMGGLLSFSMAMLDEDNDGFILNSVHSTEGCYTYTKEIVNGECQLELGNEEKMALEKAINTK